MRIEVYTMTATNRLAIPAHRGAAGVRLEGAAFRELPDGSYWVPGRGRTDGRARRITRRAIARRNAEVRS